MSWQSWVVLAVVLTVAAIVAAIAAMEAAPIRGQIAAGLGVLAGAAYVIAAATAWPA